MSRHGRRRATLGAPPRPLRDAVLAAAACAAARVGVTVDGYRRGHVPRARLGIGLAVVAASQLWRVVTGTAATVDPLFAALRLLGLVIVLVGVAQLLAIGLAALRTQHWQQQEELTRAAVQREPAGELAAERRHELRNGLAGLAGITHLLHRTDDVGHLEHAVLAELGRLRSLIDDDDPADPYADPFAGLDTLPTDYLVEPVLSGLVALRGPGGDASSCGSSPTSGHTATRRRSPRWSRTCCSTATGTRPIRRSSCAGRREDTVEIAVRDAGPGLTSGVAPTALDRGVRDTGAGGSGLGLHISRRLIERHGGTLAVRTVDWPRGCLVTITVPTAEPVHGPAERTARPVTERS